ALVRRAAARGLPGGALGRQPLGALLRAQVRRGVAARELVVHAGRRAFGVSAGTGRGILARVFALALLSLWAAPFVAAAPAAGEGLTFVRIHGPLDVGTQALLERALD